MDSETSAGARLALPPQCAFFLFLPLQGEPATEEDGVNTWMGLQRDNERHGRIATERARRRETFFFCVMLSWLQPNPSAKVCVCSSH